VSIPYVYDAGVLIAIDGGVRRMWAIHRLAAEEGRRIVVPAVVVGQAWRDGARQVQLGRLLATCEVLPTGVEVAKAAGLLCGRAGTGDVIDAVVAVTALSLGAIVFTSDPHDLARLSGASGAKPGLVIRSP